jgi:transposase
LERIHPTLSWSARKLLCDFNSGFFAACLGLLPRRHSTGGKNWIGRITKTGNSEIRRMAALGATSMVHRAEQWDSATGQWLRGALQRTRSGWRPSR